MFLLGALCIGGVGVGIVTRLAWIEGRRSHQARGRMLDACAGVFDYAEAKTAPDGFPALFGMIHGRPTQVRLHPDTFVPKRLPQLWLSVRIHALVALPRLAIIARPRGDEFFSGAHALNGHLDVPKTLPPDMLVRGQGPAARSLLLRLEPTLANIFADPRVKEIVLGPKRLRLLYQADEGQRGAHLLLRQARFDRTIEAATLTQAHAMLLRIETVATEIETRAAA